MAICLDFLSLDAYFRTITGDKIILNDISYLSLKDTELIQRELSTLYDKVDVISSIPSCDCGELKGRYLLNVLCKKCGSKCKDIFDKVEPLLWMKCMDDIKFINPHYWIMLENTISKGKFKTLRWLCDSTYNVNQLVNPIAESISNMLGKRVYSHTMQHIPEILDFVKSHDSRYKHSMSESKSEYNHRLTKIDYLKDIFMRNKDILFSTYMPLVNKKLFVIEKTTKGSFTNLSMAYMVDAIRLWVKYSNNKKITEIRKNIITCNVIQKIADLHENIYNDFVLKKQGIVRKHNYGARSDFTFRAVITSIIGPHNYNEVHIPWVIGITAFRPHILNILVNRLGYKYKDANHKLLYCIYNYDEEISNILDILIQEAPEGKLWVNMQRNPSLLQGSNLKVYISKFKKDIEDKTISISPLVVTPMNADLKIA